MTCNRDCFNCIHKDCFINETTSEEIREQDLRDRGTRYERLYTNRQRSQFRYNNSEKGKQARERYRKSEKGRENEKRKSQRKIASGKNTEYCRRYYQKKKLEKELV